MEFVKEIGDLVACFLLPREKNRTALKALVQWTHLLVRHHIAHSTNFNNIIELVVSCGAMELQIFIETTSKNVVYTSRGAVVEFIQALRNFV